MTYIDVIRFFLVPVAAFLLLRFSSGGSSNIHKLLGYIAYLLVIIVMVLRGDSGTDTSGYRYFFNNLNLTLEGVGANIVWVEPMYLIINMIVKLAGLSFEYVLFIMAFISVFLISRISLVLSIPRHVFFFYYIVTTNWLLSFNGMRQSMAALILLLLIAKYDLIGRSERVIILILSVLFHYSALAAYIFFRILSLFSVSKRSQILVLTIFFAAGLLGLNYLSSFFWLLESIPKYSSYAERVVELSIEKSGITIFYLYTYLLFVFSLAVVSKFYNSIGEVFIKISVVYFILFSVFYGNPYLERFSIYFYTFLPVLFSYVWLSLKARNSTLLMMFQFHFILFYIYNIYQNNSGVLGAS